MKKMIGLFVFLLVIGIQLVNAQEKQVTGLVTDASDGSPLPGVTVQVKGTSTGDFTDINGKYTLKVKADAVLIFTFVGMNKQEVPVNGKSVINVKLEPLSQQMDEVVVTAMGMSRAKKSLGYATQEVKAEELMATRQTDLNNALVGKVSGVRFLGGSGAKFDAGTIVLRGTSSLDAGGSAPIYVIDGVITSPEAINMDDVESVNVLKGPAATALYGSRGGNGAVIIKTKSLQGKKMEFTASHTLSFEKAYLHADYQDIYGGGAYGADGEMRTFKYDPAKHKSYLQKMDGAPYYDYKSDVSWGPKMDGRLYAPFYAWDPTDSRFGQLVPFSPAPKDNLNDLFQTGMSNTTNLSFANSGENHSIRASFTNVARKGVSPNSDAARRFFSIKANFKVSKRLDISLDYKYTYRKNHNAAQEGYGGTGNAFYTFAQWFQRNVRISDLKDYKRPDGTFRNWNINSPTNLSPAYHNNPFAIFHEENRKNIYQWNVINGNATYEITSKIKAGVTVNGNIRNYFSDLSIPENLLDETSRYSTSQNSLVDIQVQGRLTYSDVFVHDKLSLDAALFIENRSYHYESVGAFTRDGLFLDKYFNTAASSGLPGGENTKTLMRERSIFGNATLAWNNTYYLDLSVRNDWTSTLHPDNNSYLYGGVSVAAIASNWFKSEVINFWKLRASIAQVGASTDAYNIYDTYKVKDSSGDLIKYGSLSEMYFDYNKKNQNIKPTISTSYEIGTEFRMLDNRLWGDFNFYNRDAKDQIININAAGASGYSSMKKNAGMIRNRGIEVSLGGSIIKNKDWTWDISANIARNRNTLEKLTGDLDQYQLTWRSWTTKLYSFAEVGKPIGVIRGSTWKKDPDGNKILEKREDPNDPDGEYATLMDMAAQTELGNAQPDATGGFSTSLRFKNFRFNASFDFQIGGSMASVSNMYGEQSGLLQSTTGYNDRGGEIRMPLSKNGGVKVDGVVETENGHFTPVSTYMDAYYYFNNKGMIWEDYIYDASYLKMRSLSLSYDVPKAFLNKLGLGLKKATLSFVADNPWLIYSGIPNIDPSETGNAYYNYMESGQTISTRSYGFTVDITF